MTFKDECPKIFLILILGRLSNQSITKIDEISKDIIQFIVILININNIRIYI